jgi:EAL domain-containing protein (putative c-di-GMP-specific phosphodiesterase class I)
MTANAIENMALENDLRKAIKEQEFELYYQPQIDFSQNCIIGFEALIRWRHPSKGLLFPDTFIGLLEETGLIVPLGHWIIDNACQTLRQWLDTGANPVRLAINLSPRQLHNEELSDQISRSLHLHNLPAELLELEITESMLMQDIQFTHKQLRSLQQLGITIAIDDFGTGHSSLSYLKELPLDILKIDRSFIRDIIEDNNDQQIVNAIIAMAHQLNLKVVAEGIETIAHQSMLIQQGCDYGQGYLYSRPVPADSALELIKFDADKAMDSMALN